MFACADVAGDGTCNQWVEIATWAHLAPQDAADILTAVALLFASAWGFRVLIRAVVNRL